MDPEWHEAFELEFIRVPSERGLPIRVALFDRDNISSDDFLGETVIFASTLAVAYSPDQCLTLLQLSSWISRLVLRCRTGTLCTR